MWWLMKSQGDRVTNPAKVTSVKKSAFPFPRPSTMLGDTLRSSDPHRPFTDGKAVVSSAFRNRISIRAVGLNS